MYSKAKNSLHQHEFLALNIYSVFLKTNQVQKYTLNIMYNIKSSRFCFLKTRSILTLLIKWFQIKGDKSYIKAMIEYHLSTNRGIKT